METPEFEWDEEKAVSNLKKHDVSFEEGATIFNDPKIATKSPHPFKRRRKVRIHCNFHTTSFTGCRSHRTQRENPLDQLPKSDQR
jgi:uncharacterized DUF497 family protein